VQQIEYQANLYFLQGVVGMSTFARRLGKENLMEGREWGLERVLVHNFHETNLGVEIQNHYCSFRYYESQCLAKGLRVTLVAQCLH